MAYLRRDVFVSTDKISSSGDIKAETDTGKEDGPVGVGVIEHHLKSLPSNPGVYRMMNRKGDVLYVGKAKNLKKRVVDYTAPERQ